MLQTVFQKNYFCRIPLKTLLKMNIAKVFFIDLKYNLQEVCFDPFLLNVSSSSLLKHQKNKIFIEIIFKSTCNGDFQSYQINMFILLNNTMTQMEML